MCRNQVHCKYFTITQKLAKYLNVLGWHILGNFYCLSTIKISNLSKTYVALKIAVSRKVTLVIQRTSDLI